MKIINYGKISRAGSVFHRPHLHYTVENYCVTGERCVGKDLQATRYSLMEISPPPLLSTVSVESHKNPLNIQYADQIRKKNISDISVERYHYSKLLYFVMVSCSTHTHTRVNAMCYSQV